MAAGVAGNRTAWPLRGVVTRSRPRDSAAAKPHGADPTRSWEPSAPVGILGGVSGEEIIGEAIDPDGAHVILLARVWNDKVLRDHVELDGYMREVLRAVGAPDHIEPDPTYERRKRLHLRGVGPSRWLLVVVSYEQEPARIISAFGNRKDPRSWSA